MGLDIMDTNDVDALVHGHGCQSERTGQPLRCFCLASQMAYDAFARDAPEQWPLTLEETSPCLEQVDVVRLGFSKSNSGVEDDQLLRVTSTDEFVLYRLK